MSQIENFNSILQLFKLKANCVSYNKVRNISLYDIALEPGTRIKQFQKLIDEISLVLRAKTKPIMRVIPELGIIRLEVVDDNACELSFFKEFKKPVQSDNIYVGSSIDGSNVNFDIAKNPHTLIAGCTGSGKSTLLHTILANVCNDENTKTFIVDTKNSEYKKYTDTFDNVLLSESYIDAVNTLKTLYVEMEYRYNVMKKNPDYFERFPNILLIIDEFADLIMQDDNHIIYDLLCKLSQKCRAASIYCVVATQRPSVDILGGAIKANFPARISCKVASNIDSRVILDSPGAELLAGAGDAIIKNYKYNYQRFQVAYTTSEEVCNYYGK